MFYDLSCYMRIYFKFEKLPSDSYFKYIRTGFSGNSSSLSFRIYCIYFFDSSLTFGWLKRPLISSNSKPDLITTPLFIVIEPSVSIGLISIAKDAGLPLEVGSLNRNAPGMLVAFLSQFPPSFRK
jgi:hypothetical protein